jgi:hypothetical protein
MPVFSSKPTKFYHFDIGAATAHSVRAWAGAVAGLAAADQLVLDQFLALPLPQRLRRLHLLVQFEQAPPDLQALSLQILNDHLPDKDVARLVGKSPRQLRRYSVFQTAKRLRRQQDSRLPRGHKGRDGHLEAWDEEP